MIQRVYHGIPSTNPKKYFPWRFCGQPDVRIIIPVTFKGVMQYTNPFCFFKTKSWTPKTGGLGMVYRFFFGYWLVDAWWLVHYCFVDTDWLVVRFVGLIIGQKDLAFGLLISLCQHWEPAPVGRIWRIPSTVHQNKRCHGEWYCVYIYIYTYWLVVWNSRDGPKTFQECGWS